MSKKKDQQNIVDNNQAAMKAFDGNEWYEGYKIEELLIKHTAKGAKVLNTISTIEGLNDILKLVKSGDGPYIIPLNVRADTKELGKDTNHWVGLYIRNQGDSYEVTYIDPMGHKIGDEIVDIIKNAFSVDIKQPLLEKGIQFVEVEKYVGVKIVTNLVGNKNDCGPFLVYCMACLTRELKIVKNINSLEKSNNFGQFLRKCFNETVKFENIYQISLSNYDKFTIKDIDTENILSENTLTIPELKTIIEQIISSVGVTNTEKLKQLKIIEQKEYKPLLRQLAYSNKAEELTKLVELLDDLGYIYKNLARLSAEIKYYTDSAIYYQYILTIAQEKLKLATDNKVIIHAYQQLSSIRELIISSVANKEEKIKDIKEEVIENKQAMVDLREKAKQAVEKIELVREQGNQELYINKSRELFKEIAKEMKDFLARLYKESEREIGIDKPCEYTVIGLGSMALEQMTPYSDLEFAILIENERTGVKEYFKNLSHLVHFKIINLGETIIPNSRYGLDISHLVHRAVNFDLGGKTPLGRIEQDKPYDLIQTVDKMLWYFYNSNDKVTHIDKSLPQILSKICYVHGDKQLFTDYQSKVTEFLQSKSSIEGKEDKLNCEIKAIKVLLEGCTEIDYNKGFTHLKVKSIEGEIEKFQPDLVGVEGRLFNVKEEIYRLPDRLLYNLGMLYNIEADSAWDTVDKLYEKEILNQEAADNLKNVVTFAVLLRLKTYLHNKEQREDMSIFAYGLKDEDQVKKEITEVFRLSKKHLGENGVLFQYFYTVLPFYEELEDFCNEYDNLAVQEKKGYFKENNFYENNHKSKGFIYARLLRNKEALSHLEIAREEPQNQDNYDIKRALATIYSDFGQGEKAVILNQERLELCSRYYEGVSASYIADSLRDLAWAFYIKGNYKEAIEEGKKCLQIFRLIHEKTPHPAVADALNNLGVFCNAVGKYQQAIEFHLAGLDMQNLIYNGQTPLHIVHSLTNLGISYQNLGDYNKAKEYYIQSLKITKVIYKEEPHLDIADCLNNLGVIHRVNAECTKAIQYHLQSLNIYNLFYKDIPHPAIATTLHNIGLAFLSLENYDKAIEYSTQSMEMLQELHKSEIHSDVAESLSRFGTIYENIGRYEQAIDHFIKSIEMQKRIYKEEPHPHLAYSLGKLGSIYNKIAKYEEAIDYCNQSLKMQKRIYKEEPHHSIADSLEKLGVIYCNIQEYEIAMDYCQQSLKMFQRIHEDEPNISIASSLGSIGNIYLASKDYAEAKSYYIQSLEMQKFIIKEQPSHNMASVLGNLGIIYRMENNYDKALEYYTQCMDMQKRIYKEEPHHSIADSLSNLGEIWGAKEDYDQAIWYCIKALEMQKLLYKQESHPDIAFPYANLGEIYKMKGEYSKSLYYCSEALKIINEFQYGDYNDIKTIVARAAIEFANNYSFNPQSIVNKIFNWPVQEINFTDCQLHFQLALELPQLENLNNTNYWQQIIEECQLTLIFAPEEAIEIKRIIEENLLNITTNNLGKELWKAVTNSDIEKVQELCDQNADINILIQGTTPLIQAIIRGDEVAASILIALGVDFNKPNHDHATPLYCAIGFYNQEINMNIIDILLERGANVNTPMNDGDTPLHMAAYRGESNVIKLLLDKGADINAQNLEKKTSLLVVIELEHTEFVSMHKRIECIKILLEYNPISYVDEANQFIAINHYNVETDQPLIISDSSENDNTHSTTEVIGNIQNFQDGHLN